MHKIANFFFIFFLACMPLGCGNLSPRDNASPRMQQQIDNQNGKIDKIENNQNSLRAQIEKLGLINKENSGVQIFEGDGALILVFGIIVILLVLIYFYKIADNYKKLAEILASEIAEANHPQLENNIAKAVSNTEVAEKYHAIMAKARRFMRPKN